MTEDTSTLPEGWDYKRVGDVLSLRNGYPFKPTDWATSGRPIIRIQNLKSESAAYNHYQGELPDRFMAQCGDLLFAWSGTPGTSFGAHVWEGSEAWVNQHIFRVDFSGDDFDRDFLKLALNYNLADYIAQAQGGVGLAHITKAKLNRSLLVHPPVPVQKAIADLVARHEALRSEAVSQLATAERSAELFRKAILEWACSGRLTETWRQQRSPEESDQQGSLPQTWKRVHIGDLAASIRGGSGEVPGNSLTEFPILRSSSVRSFEVDYADVKYLDLSQSQREANFLQDGDLLITRLSGSVEYVGKCAIVRDLEGQRIQYPDRLFCCRLKDGNSPDFIELAFAGPELRSQIEVASRSAAGHQRISISDLKGFYISLYYSRCFSVCDRAKAQRGSW
jgi:type I restriction enzyme S subunit